MPYSPGVVDISGQLRADGKRAMTRGISQGVSEGFREYSQNKLRNSVLQGENEGLLKAFMSDPETAKYAPADLEKFIEKTQKGGGLSLKDNIQMNGMLNATLKTRGVIEQQKEAAQMRQVREQEMKARAMQIQAAQAEQEAVGKLQRLAQLQQGVGGGVLRPDVQARQQEQLKDELTQFAIKKVNLTGRPLSDADLREFSEMKRGGNDTAIIQNVNYIIDNELKAGTLKPEDVAARRAELAASGGQDQGEIYDNAGTYVDRDTGQNPTPIMKVRRGKKAGQLGTVGPDGVFTPIDLAKKKPVTLGDSNQFLPPEVMLKLASEVTDKENAVRGLLKFVDDADDLPKGINKLSTKISATAKTILGEELSPAEKQMGVAKARQERLLGALRTTILGPGVLTEIDAGRIIAAVGGNIESILTNPEVMNEVLGEILEEKIRSYETSLEIYNANASGAHKSGGHAPRQKLERKAKKVAEKLSEATGANQTKPMTADDLAAKWLKK